MVSKMEWNEINAGSEATDALARAARKAKRPWAAALALCLSAFLLSSCGNSQLSTAAMREATAPALQTIGERAEGIILAVPAEDWPRVYAYIQDIDNRWKDYKRPTVTGLSDPPGFPAGMLRGDLDAALASLRYQAAAKDSPGTIQAAGRVSGAAAELIGFYNPDRPSALHRLAVHEKRIMIQATEGDLVAASTSLDNVRGAWGRARTAVVVRAGDVVARGFDELIAEQQAAIQARNLPRLASGAQVALNMINDMQQLNY